jgi:FG-GAP-like repeat
MIQRFWILVGAAALVLSLIAKPAGATCPGNNLLGQASINSVGENPFHVIVADFNGDDISDLAVTVNGTSHIGILIGHGDGTFENTVHYSVQLGSGHLVAKDFNLDGYLDIATNSGATNSITVLPGNGDGTFAAPSFVPVYGQAPYGVTSADFNNDDIPDLASADLLSNAVSVILGQPGGGFSAPTSATVGVRPYDIQTADLDEDGNADIVVSNQNGQSISFLRGMGDGTFESAVHYGTGSYPYKIALGDLNADGILDLAVATGGSATVTVLRGNGSDGVGHGTFAPPLTLFAGGEPRSVSIGFFNDDDHLDLVVADYGGTVGILIGLGNGLFLGPYLYRIGGHPTDVAVGDFNGDSKLDVAVVRYAESGEVAILLNQCVNPPPGPEPIVTEVRDVENDQGKHVLVSWKRSALDLPGNATITGYRLWRLNRATDLWEQQGTVPAVQLPDYSFVATTTRDSLSSGNPHTAFFVSALTDDPETFYESNVDSGYSVDNLPPDMPAGLTAITTANGVELAWTPNSEEDLDSYRIYRGLSFDFVPGSGNLIGPSAVTTFVDPAGNSTHFYKITAIDSNENEGPTALAAAGPYTGVDDAPLVFSLRGAMPNPSRDGRFSISFSLANSSPAKIELIDAAGRRVLEKALHGLGAGTHTIDLGRQMPIPGGLYVVRLSQAGRAASSKVVVFR